jgi:HlyD family secretion protein
MMKRLTPRARKLTVAVVSVAVIALGVTTLRGSNGTEMPPLTLVPVEEGDISRTVVAHGAVQPVQTITVGSQVSGIVDEVHVDFNDRVERGQVLARIDPATFEAEYRSARAELDAAESNLELARLQWSRIQALRENQLAPASEVDQAAANLRNAEAQLTVRRHAVERTRRELERATIYAPTDGIIISRGVDVGQTVAASLSAPELFEIATDLSDMRVHAMVSEADVGVVREGQTARFTVDAHRGRTFTGQVVQVRNAPLVESNVVHYETIIAVANEEGLLRPGMTAEIAIVTDEVAGTVRVRNTALRARLPDGLRPPEVEGEGTSVFRMVNGELVAARVMTGLADDVYTQILGGVEPGDSLVVGVSLQSENGEGRRSLFGGNQAQF